MTHGTIIQILHGNGRTYIYYYYSRNCIV